jgi:predicted N-acyltransferase
LKTRVYSSIAEIAPETWNRLVAGSSCTLAHEFWQVLEEAKLESFRLRYALFHDDNENPVALAAFYVVTTDIAIFAPGVLRRALAAIRRHFPGFLLLRVLECGTPITLNRPPIAAGPSVTPAALLEAVDALLQDEATREGVHVIVIRDFEPDAQDQLEGCAKLGYAAVDGLPNTYLDIAWDTPQAYLTSLRSYYRSKLSKHTRRTEALGIRHVLTEDFGDRAPELCAQWRVVHDHASEFQREVLTPDFYRALSALPGRRAKALLFYRADELVAHALLLHDGHLLRWLYFGRREAANDSLYIHAAHTVIETAILLRASRLEMGLTTYPVKQDLGARMCPIRIALRARPRWASAIVAWGYRLLNRPPPLHNKAVFHDPYGDGP